MDQYALSSQEETLRAKQAENALSEVEANKIRLALKIIRENDADRAELFRKLFSPAAEEGEEDNAQ